MAERQEVYKGNLTKSERIIKGLAIFMGTTVFGGVYGASLGDLAHTDDGIEPVDAHEIYAAPLEQDTQYPAQELPTGKIGIVIGAAVGAEAFKRVK